MKHPDREILAAYLYEELPPAQSGELESHLALCVQCRDQLESWKNVRKTLAAWKMPADSGSASAPPWQPARRVRAQWKRAALGLAASILVLAGFGLARLTAPKPPDSAALRESVTRQVRAELRGELAAWAAEQTQRQDASQEALARALGRLEEQRLADYAQLRRDIETMAVHTQNAFLDTSDCLFRLAGGKSPAPLLPNP